MRILFVHEVNWRSKIVYEIHDFPELLSLRGHECVFIDFPEGKRPRGAARLLDLHTETARGLARAHSGAHVEVRTPGRVFAPPLDRLAASATQIPVIRSALSREQFDAVVLYAVPTNGWQTVRIARSLGVPVLFRALDVSHALRKTIFSPLISAAERYIYREADGVSCNNEALRRYCIENGAHPKTTSVEYPGLDLERFAPGPRPPELCKKYGIHSKHRIAMFMGTFYRFAGLEWFLKQFAPVLRRRPEFRIMLVGGGEQEGELRRLAGQAGISNSVIFTGFIDYPGLADHLRMADVGFNTFQNSLVTDCALPSKVVQYLGCGIPTVCTPLAGMQGMMPEEKGVLYRPLDHSFIEAIESLLTDDERRAVMSRVARSEIERLCRWDVCIEALEAAITRAITSAEARGGA